ncbi:MAG: hypothetical protein L3J70_11510 [Gammaproteobacteria bacterium]|nr:hypothetical protein [Gammaproteobacteria bacterium]
MNIFQHKLDGGASVIWAVPLSGYGHIADEQPLPYIHYQGKELTPRFGGEDGQEGCGLHTIGLPWGILKNRWPLSQKIFNIFRKNINIYWRNIFVSRCRADKNFYFLEQLDYIASPQGFMGESPLIRFERKFLIEGASVQVEDTIVFKKTVLFEVFYPVNIPLLDNSPIKLISKEFLIRRGKQRSSAGEAVMHVLEKNSIEFKEGDTYMYQYKYYINKGNTKAHME